MFMPERIDTVYFAPCGMNCMVCYVHLKDKKPCHGCLANDENKPDHCRVCTKKTCAQNKGLLYCFECDEFPCKQIKSLDKSYKTRYGISLIEYSDHVKEEGLDTFMKEQILRWKCPDCGGVISLHDKMCSECGKSF